jgi:hypothetical protein
MLRSEDDMTLTFGSLFAGIGGFDLGFERAGMVCKWQVEIDDYCNKVLAKHWPDVERFRDVRECGKSNLKPVDVICGGFPCQDVSIIGKREGLKGQKSTLWASLGPNGWLLKTQQGFTQAMMDGSLQKYSGSYPKAGMMQNGTLYRRVSLVHYINAKEYLLWPTPTASKGNDGEKVYTYLKRAHRDGGRGLTIAMACALAPEPGTTPPFIHYNPSKHNYKQYANHPRGRANPEFVEWLMGFPVGYTDLEP